MSSSCLSIDKSVSVTNSNTKTAKSDDPKPSSVTSTPSTRNATSATIGSNANIISSDLDLSPGPILRTSLDRKIKRGFSRSQGNEDLVQEVRTRIQADMKEEEGETKAPYLVETADYTFLLPDLTVYGSELRAFLEKELIEMSSLVSLEQTGRLNWWSDVNCLQRLWPLSTSGDGNCLLHAASLGMWGVHDRLLTLRHALHHRLANNADQIYRRWRWQLSEEYREQGFRLSEADWRLEWNSVQYLSYPSPKRNKNHTSQASPALPKVDENDTNTDASTTVTTKPCCTNTGIGVVATPEKSEEKTKSVPEGSIKDTPVSSDSTVSMASPTTALSGSSTLGTPDLGLALSGGGTSEVYESLEQIHIFVLAQVIRRPVVVVADRMLRDVRGEPVQAINIGGVYLPLLEPPELCQRNPLMLTYVNSHFSALVPMSRDGCQEKDTKPLLGIPLVDPATFDLLPIHFAVDPGDQWKWSKDDEDPKKLPDPTKRMCLTEEASKSLLETYLECSDISLKAGSTATSTSSLGDSLGNSSHSSYEETDSLVSSTQPTSTIGASAGMVAGSSATMPGKGSQHQPLSLSNSAGSGSSGKSSRHSHKRSGSDSGGGKERGSLLSGSSSMATKMGSLGRNIGKQLKKALRGHSSSSGGERRKSISGVNTQSTSHALTWDKIGQRESLFCALLHVKPPPRYQEMIDNYLRHVEDGFSELDQLHKLRSQAIVQRAEERRVSLCGSLECGTPGCTMYGQKETGNLCSLCYRTQGKSSPESTSSPPSQMTTDSGGLTPSGSLSPSNQSGGGSNTPTPTGRQPELSSLSHPTSTLDKGEAVSPPKSSSGSVANLSSDGMAMPCHTNGCLFYGQSAKRGYCSKCFPPKLLCSTPGCPNQPVPSSIPQTPLCETCYRGRNTAQLAGASSSQPISTSSQHKRVSPVTTV